MRWLPLFLLLLSPALPAQEPEVDGRERLALAIRFYRAGEHDKAQATLINLLNDPAVENLGVEIQARVYLGEVLLAKGSRNEALEAFRTILELDPSFLLDPYEHPPDVVEFFDLVRAATRDLAPDDPPPPLPPAPIPPPPTLQPLHWTGYAPFGIHQLRQGRGVWFSVLAVGQVGTLAGSFATGVPLYMDHEGYQEEYDRLLTMRTWNWVLTGSFASLWILGTVEASAHWRGDHRRRLAAWEAEHATSELQLLPGGVRWELEF
jgi:tetratricopeptide (TPR) repeat protein